MDNQKGSVKDRLRARLLYLQYKKNKRKCEKELVKKKKAEYEARIKAEHIRIYGKPYSKKKVFILTLLGLLLGLITPKGYKKSIQFELDIIEKEQKQIFLNLEQDKDIREIYDRVDNTYQKLENLKNKYKKQLMINSFNPIDNDKLLNKIDKKQRELIVINEICHNKENQISMTNKLFKEKKELLKENKSNNLENKHSTYLDNQVDYSLNLKATKNSLEQSNILLKDEQLVLNKVKEMNTNIKEHIKQLEIIEERIYQEELYNTLFEYEFKLKQIRIRLKKMLEEYEQLKEQCSLEKLDEIIDIDVIDKYDLRKNEHSILTKLDECNILLQKIENKKADLSINKNLKKDTSDLKNNKGKNKTIEQPSKNRQEKEKKELKAQFDDIYLANKVIINNIVEEKKMIEKLKKKINNQSLINKKKTVFVYAKGFTSSILNFSFSLFPISFFRNRLLGTLVSCVMLNNSLRSTRKILTFDSYKDNYIFYNNLLNEINSNEDYISRIYETCLDSQTQIDSIKEHLNSNYSMMREYDSELLEFYKQLDKLHDDLEQQIDNIHKMYSNYSDIKSKIKTKTIEKDTH